MKKPPNKDAYIFTEESVSGLYGFDCFLRPDDDHYCFTFNDADGKPVLFSQGYSSAVGRDNGVQSVLKNAQQEGRFEIFKVAEGEASPTYYLVLKAGNHQEIARSRPGYGLRDINKLRDMCLAIGDTAPRHDQSDNADATETPAVVEPVIVEVPVEVLEEAAVSSCIPCTRQLFHLMFYTDNKTCKIEHVITGDREVIKGMSGEAIAAFVQKYLSEDWPEDSTSSVVKKAVEEAVPSTPISKRMVIAESRSGIKKR